MKRSLILAAVLLAGTSMTRAAEPVGADSFNIEAPFDLKALTAENFYDVIVPLAKQDGSFTFFDFTNSFGPLFQEHLLPAFEDKYGIKVDYVRGKGEVATQQLIAATNAGKPAPADAYFLGSGDTLSAVMNAGVMANLPLDKILPSAADMNPALLTVAAGKKHGGAYMPFHLNQTSMVYNTAMVSEDDMPDDLAGLKAWAEAHPGKVAVTNPARGGSGDGFLQSVALGLVQGDDCRAAFTDFSLTGEAAAKWAESDCATPIWDYYRAMLPVVELTNGNSDTLNLVANGAAAIGTAWEDMAYDFMGRGLLPATTRQELLVTGQVGGGDGMFVPTKSGHLASALLFIDFMLSHDMQVEKLGVNGSRSARLDIDPAASFSAEQANRLIPTDQFAKRAVPQMPQALKSALKEYFLANILAS